MSHSLPRRGRRALALLASLSLATAGVSTAATAATAAPSDRGASVFSEGRYVVLLADTPAAAYEGDLPGYARTRPNEGRSYGKGNAEARYERYLQKKQDAVLERVDARASDRWTVAVNGFAAQLTGAQAAKLAGTRGVLAVTPDEARSLDTTSSPEFLGLTGATGTWSEAGGVADAGDGVVVGVIDTGIWPESASFSGKPLSDAPGQNPRTTGATAAGEVVSYAKKDGSTFTGLCQAGEQWAADDCNTKLISARYFSSGFEASVPRAEWAATEQLSTRDGGGHGSHTASTAAGNADVPVTIDGSSYGHASGVAPGAKVAAYKVCWEDTDPNTGDCYTSDSVAAIDQAVQDGVDVLNYSISGARTTVVDAVEFAFFNAAAAGVFVAASAGNSGPTASTVAHNSPWLTTVAASTHTSSEGTVVTGSGQRYKGASVNRKALPQTPAVLSSALGADGVAASEVAICAPGSLADGSATGKIVVCDRGVYARVDKSAEVKRAGGTGMILVNVGPSSLDADVHTVPTVHVDHVSGAAIKSYLASAATPTTAFETGDTTGGAATPVPQIAGFSSRGPALANDSDLLKPDITAPGVSVVAAVAPPANSGRDYDLYSGTSMSSPHIAGLAALVLDVHPQWSPMTVKSAMMTTAYDLKSASGAVASDPFAQGAGHVDPTDFLTPGLVVTSGPADWAGFYAAQGLQLSEGKPYKPIAATDLNVPSIAISKLAGSQTVKRTFHALAAGRYTVAVDLPGFSVQHRSTLPFTRAGQEQQLELAFTRTTAPLGTYAKGFVTLTEAAKGTKVRLPVALRPVAVAAPAEVSGTGTTGSAPVTITAGSTGSLAVDAQGLAAGKTVSGSLAVKDYEEVFFDIAPGTSIARFDVDAANDAGDFDLSVYRLDAAGTELVALAGQSATGAADERVDLVDPVAGKYVAYVDNYAAALGETTSAYTRTTYLVDASATAGALTVTPNPAPVTQGAAATLTASWSGLTAGTRYLGVLTYDGAPARTLLSVTG